MTQEQLKNFETTASLVHSGTLSTKIAASMLKISQRQFQRWLQGRNLTSRLCWNRISDDVRDYVKTLKQEDTSYNCQWIAELASDHFGAGISQSSVWRILQGANLLGAKELIKITRSRFEAKRCGDIVQLDTTWGYWMNNDRLCLILLLDDHSRYILAAEFFYEDSAYNNMWMVRDVITDYGTFKLLYTDNASFFKPIRHNQSFYQVHRQTEYESEITRACKEVGITHITHKPYQPQSKGKIERLFGFIQKRVISQFEKNHVNDLETANGYLWEWIDWYNYKHVNRTTGETPKKRFDPKGFTPLPGSINLDDVFCFKDTRKVDSCNQFSYKGITYTIPKEHCMVAFKVELHIHPYQRIRVWRNDQFICELPIPYEN